jgi:hypothetical protein
MLIPTQMPNWGNFQCVDLQSCSTADTGIGGCKIAVTWTRPGAHGSFPQEAPYE